MDWFHIFSSKEQDILISFSLIKCYIDFVIKFFLKMDINFWM